MFCPTVLAVITLWKTVHLNKQLECITICRNRNCNYEMMHKTMDDLRATEADNIVEIATLAAMISRISDGKVVMFTPLVLQLSIAIRRNAE
jgi:hypothetical protein